MKSLNLLLLSAAFAVVSLAPATRAADKPAKLTPYPLETCVVSGEKLGDMGKPVVYEFKGREIKFCCKSCQKDFNKDSAKFIKKLEEAEAKAAKKTESQPKK